MAPRGTKFIFALCFGLVIIVARSGSDLPEDDLDDGDLDDFDVGEAVSGDQLRAMHKKFDRDGDGKVSIAEIMAYAHETNFAMASRDITTILDEIDTNKDGLLSLEEHVTDIENQVDGGDAEEKNLMRKRLEVERAKFRAADDNKDGQLQSKELPALFYPETHEAVLAIMVAESMRSKDLDGNNMLTPKEFWEAVDEDGTEDMDLSEEEHIDFEKLDLDNDGQLDLKELQEWESGRFHVADAMQKMFDIADKDNDMHVTADELANTRELIAVSDAQYHLIEWVEHYEL